MRIRFLTRRRRCFALALLLPALLLRALVPAGFMPSAHAETGIALELCTSDGLRTVFVDLDGDPLPSVPESHRESPCAYAIAGGAAPPPGPMAIGLLPSAAHAPRVALHSEAPPRPLERAHAPRAPPLQA